MTPPAKPVRQPERGLPSPESELLSDSIMREEDQRRLVRLLQRTLGTGFKLAFVEVSSPRDRTAVLDWLAPVLQAKDARLHTVDVGRHAKRLRDEGFNLWTLLHQVAPPGEMGPREVLALWGLEEVMYSGRPDRSQLLQQINVQRDILVRDFPFWWLLFIHPESRQSWWSIAPDFCDLASIWCEEARVASRRGEMGALRPTPEISPQHISSAGVSHTQEWPRLLRLADEHLTYSRFAEALDAIHSFRAERATRESAPRDHAIADMLEAQVYARSGDPELALRLLSEQVVPTFERLQEPHLRAEAFGAIGDVLMMRGDFDEALRIRREEELPVYERLGDVRSRALTLGKIADVLFARGELDEALRIRREEQLPVYERLGDVHSRAVTLGEIADVLSARGELDEALRTLREEVLPAFERLGNVYFRAVTLAKIADVLSARGELDEELRTLREEVLPVFERLGDVRSRAVTLGRIADVLSARGELDEALRILREEELPVYERLGDVRSRAVTLGQIADLLAARGELDEALRIRREDELPVYERLGYVRELILSRVKVAMMLVQRGRLDDMPEVVEHLRWAYAMAAERGYREAAEIAKICESLGVQLPEA